MMHTPVSHKVPPLPSLRDDLLLPFRLIWRYREIVRASVLSELKSTYAGSVLGMAWIALGPFFLLCLYSLVYGVIFRVRPPTMSLGEYIVYVLAGLTAFMGFSSGVTIGAQSLARNKQLLLSTTYPSELLAVRTVLVQSAQVVAGIGLTIILCFLLGKPSAWLLAVPLIVVLQILFTCGLVWILSLVSLALRDIQHILQYVMFVFLIITPIGYDRELVPRALQWLMYFNPLYYFVSLYQDAMVFGKMSNPATVVVAVLGSVATFIVAFRIFRRAKQVFFDYA